MNKFSKKNKLENIQERYYTYMLRRIKEEDAKAKTLDKKIQDIEERIRKLENK